MHVDIASHGVPWPRYLFFFSFSEQPDCHGRVLFIRRDTTAIELNRNRFEEKQLPNSAQNLAKFELPDGSSS